MKEIILTKQFVIGLLLSVGLGLLLSTAPAPRPASLPVSDGDIANSPLALRQAFLGDDEFDPLAAELAAELAEMPRYDQPDEAMTFYLQQRLPTGATELPVEQYAIARQQMEDMPQYSTKEGRALPSRRAMREQGLTAQSIGTWESLGPGNIGGRTRAILIDPGNPNIMYAAGVSGGVWKTTDAGSSWTPLDDFMANLAVASMAMDPGDSSVIYAGTGEGFFNGDAVRGDGIFKTTNGGATWTQLANTADDTNFHFVNDLVVSPNDSNRVYAATRSGVWRSDNAGTSWNQVLAPGVNGGCTDLAIRTDVSPNDTLFTACGTFVQATIYRSTDNGDTWPAAGQFTEANMGRTSLAIAPSNQNILYAAAASIDGTSSYNNGLHAVFRSTNGGDSWGAQVRNTDGTFLNTLLFTNPPFANSCPFFGSGFFNQGWYDNVVAVDPVDPDRVWVGGIDLFRSDNAGVTWGLTSVWWADPSESRYSHADHHAVVFHPNYDGTTNQTMYNGNDGGVFRTDNARAATTTDICNPTPSVVWNNLNNGYGVTQFYHGVPYPDGTTYLGGTQDNGTNRGSDGAGTEGWNQIFGGDGGYVAVDPTNTDVVFLETTRLSLRKATDGGASPFSFSSATTGITEPSGNFLFINPFTMDPSNPDILWMGGGGMWRTTNQAASWTSASTFIDGVTRVSAHAVAPTDSNYVLAGTEGGTIGRNQNALSATGTTVWPTTQPTTGPVSWLTFDPTDENIAYATYSTFGVDHVWKSENAGQTWTAIDNRDQPNGIPNIPVHTIAVDPTDTQRLFVGTDLGVFVSSDGGNTWLVENSGFANVVTEALYFNEVGGVYTLFAFTHGRGAYRITPKASTPQLTVTKTASPEPIIAGEPFTYTISVRNDGATSATGVTITDTVPANTTLADSSLSGDATNSGTAAGSLITWSLTSDIATNETISRTFVVTVTDGLTVNTAIVNTAYVSATNETALRSGAVTITAVAKVPQLTLTKTASPDPVASGGSLTYGLVVRNEGASNASGVTITDTVPTSTTLNLASLSGDGTASGTAAGSLITWSLASDIAFEEVVTRTFEVTIDTDLSDGTQILNTAYVSATNVASVTSGSVSVTIGSTGGDDQKIYLPIVVKN